MGWEEYFYFAEVKQMRLNNSRNPSKLLQRNIFNLVPALDFPTKNKRSNRI